MRPKHHWPGSDRRSPTCRAGTISSPRILWQVRRDRRVSPWPQSTLPATPRRSRTGVWLQLSADVLNEWTDWADKGLPVEWSQYTGPGTAEFSDRFSANSLVRFDVAGDYELHLSIISEGLTIVARLAVTATVAQGDVININQAWLNAQGEGPYYLDQQGKTYTLADRCCDRRYGLRDHCEGRHV